MTDWTAVSMAHNTTTSTSRPRGPNHRRQVARHPWFPVAPSSIAPSSMAPLVVAPLVVASLVVAVSTGSPYGGNVSRGPAEGSPSVVRTPTFVGGGDGPSADVSRGADPGK